MTASAKTIGQIKDEVGDYVANTQTVFYNKMDQWIIDIHREVEQVYNFSWLIKNGLIQLRENKKSYTLPSDFFKFTGPDAIKLADNYHLTYVDEWQFEDSYGLQDNETASNVQFYTLSNEAVFVQNQPDVPDKISLVSTSGSDTTQTIYIEGTVNGVEGVTESVTLTGQTIANSTKSYSYVKRISKSASTTGIVTATTNGSKIIVVLPYRSRALSFRTITLYPVPNSDLHESNLVVKYYSKIPDHMDDGAVSHIPDPNVLIHGLIYRAFKNQKDSRETLEFQLYNQAIENLIYAEKRKNAKYNSITPVFSHPNNLSV